MTGDLYVAVAFIVGVLLGIFYYGTLWLTVSRLSRFTRPPAVLLLSFIGRAAVVVGAFYVLMQGQWYNVVAALLGFIGGRFIFDAYIKPHRKSRVIARSDGVPSGTKS